MVKNNISKPRLFLLSSFIAIAFSCFVYRLIDWQVFKGEELRIRANFNAIYDIPIKAIRGEILDENGVSLAVNEVVYQVVFDRFKIQEESLNKEISFLIDLFKKKKQKWIDNLPIVIKDGKFVFLEPSNPNDEEEKKKIERNIELLKGPDVLNLNSYASAEECMLNLFDRFKLSDNESLEKKRDIASLRARMIMEHFDTGEAKMFVFANGLTGEMTSIVSGLSGGFSFRVNNDMKRKIRNSTLLSHILGTVGKLSKDDYEELKSKGYALNDVTGQYGIERALEKELRGKNGRKVIEITKEGEIKSQLIKEEVVHGDTVFLTINAHLQKVANESVERNVLASTSKSAGAVVVLRVDDFSVLAAATYPNYDLAKYKKDSKYYNKLVSDNVNKPLLNRCFDDAYEPGSAFKVVVACAGLQEGLINMKHSVHCSRGWYLPGSTHHVPCMGYHGNIEVQRAIFVSCNAFFLDTAHRLGIDKICEYAKKFGLGVKTGVEIHETVGSLAHPDRRRELGGKWYPTDTAFAGIGQSDNMFSPLQLATYAATVANDGVRCMTHLVRKRTDYLRKDTVFENDPKNPQVVDNLDVSKENMEIVREGMYWNCTKGTASNPFASYNISLASKTGTSQNPSGIDHKVIIVYGPTNDKGAVTTEGPYKDFPPIAVASVIPKGGTYNQTYKYITRDIFDAYFKGVGKDVKFD
ncbi:MAG: hypothetical protein LBH37_00840 [Oscillospiraceae bacterium]|jgi:penicillin-binding protein 2|nr:hypothetical protein [Oscillospiraceae bacterium]